MPEWQMTIKSPSQAVKKPTSWASASGRSGSRMTEGSPQPTLWTHHCLLHHTSHSSIPRVTTFSQMPIISFFFYAVPLPRILSPACHYDQSFFVCSEPVQASLAPSGLVVLIFLFLIFYAYFSLYLQCPSKYDYGSLCMLISSVRHWTPRCQGTYFFPFKS